jgi:RHS repeat-associated protein
LEAEPASGQSVQRYYDPLIGQRFLSVDPVTPYDAGGAFNRFWYANANPYKFTDPDGRHPTCDEKQCTGTVQSLADLAYVAAVYLQHLIASHMSSSSHGESDNSSGSNGENGKGSQDSGNSSKHDGSSGNDNSKNDVEDAIKGVKEGKMHAPGKAGERGELIGDDHEGDWERLQNVPGAKQRDPNNIQLPDGSNANRHGSTRPYPGGMPAGTPTIKWYPPGSTVPGVTIRYP